MDLIGYALHLRLRLLRLKDEYGTASSHQAQQPLSGT